MTILQVNMLSNPLSSCTLTSLANDKSFYPTLRGRLANDLYKISRFRWPTLKMSHQNVLFVRDVKGRRGGYKFLDPEKISCSINIWLDIEIQKHSLNCEQCPQFCVLVITAQHEETLQQRLWGQQRSFLWPPSPSGSCRLPLCATPVCSVKL